MSGSRSKAADFPFPINRLTQSFVNAYFDATTDVAREKIKLDCLFSLLKQRSLENDDLIKHKALQTALLEHILGIPAEDERREALKLVIDSNSQVGLFFLIGSERKPPSLKREHGLLFKALRAYSELATEADARESFLAASQLAQLVTNRRKRSPIVLSTLLTLLQKSLSRAHPSYTQAVFNQLMQSHKNNIRELVLNAYSPAITKQFLDLLESMMQHGLSSSDMLTLIETKMQTEYRHNASLADLVSYHADHTLVDQFSKLLVSCDQSDADLPRIRGILNQRVLSIGYVFSSETRESNLDKVIAVVNKSEKVDAIFRLWQSGVLVEEKGKLYCGLKSENDSVISTNFKNPRIQKLMIDYILNLSDPEQKALALTLAESSKLFPTERTRIDREFEALRPREPQRRPVIRRPAAPVRAAAPQPSQPAVVPVAPQPVAAPAPVPAPAPMPAPAPEPIATAPQHYPTLHESAPLPSQHVTSPPQSLFPTVAYAVEPQPQAEPSAPMMTFIPAPEPMMLPHGPLVSFLTVAPPPVMTGNNPFMQPQGISFIVDADLSRRLEELKASDQPVYIVPGGSSTASIMSMLQRTAEPLAPASPAPLPSVVSAPAPTADDWIAQLAALSSPIHAQQLRQEAEEPEPIERKKSPTRQLSD